MSAKVKNDGIRQAVTGGAVLFMVSCGTIKNENDVEVLPASGHTFRTNGIEEHLSSARASRGRMFLAENAKKPGIVERPSGLQFLVISKGTGPSPRVGDIVVTSYRLFNTKGDLIDDSVHSGGPLKLEVDKVIAGWREALQEMRVGARWKIFLPAELAYGKHGLANIPGGETLVYDLTLHAINSDRIQNPAARLPVSDTRSKGGNMQRDTRQIPATGVRVRDNLDLID